MTQTMLEKMEEAIADSLSRVPGYFGRYDDVDGTKVVRLDGDFSLTEIARAALQALREPTEEVKKALGYEFANTFTDPLDVISVEEAEIFQFDPETTEDLWLRPVAELVMDDAVTVFQAAINAILQEKPQAAPK